METMLQELPDVAAPQLHTGLRPAYLCGLGTSVPEREVSNQEIAARFDDLTADGVESRTGIRRRYYAAPGENTSDLAVAASRAALEQAEVDPRDVDLILLATSSPDHLMPATACRVQHMLGASRAAAMDLSAACSGFIYSLWVGQQFIASGQAKCVLVVGADIMSRIIDPRDRQCALVFGDGAGAAVLSAAGGPYRLGRFWAKTMGEQYSLLLREGGTENPVTLELIAEGRHFLHMDGRRVFRAAVAGFCEAIEQTAALNGVGLREVDWIVPHQSNVRIFAEVAAKLNIPLDLFWQNIARYGNTGAASIPLALADLQKSWGVPPSDRVLLACVGAGMTAGGTMLFAD
jgi:3-oxoacyl-[acyl-carrier-protein] synthase-3